MSASYIQENVDTKALVKRTLLDSLDIHDCGDFHDNFQWIEKLEFIEKLSLDLNRLCDHDLVPLSKLSRLWSLALRTNAYITGEKFPSIPTLKELIIVNERINDTTIKDVCSATPNLTSFSYLLSGWSSVCPCEKCEERKKKDHQKPSKDFALEPGSNYYSRECKGQQKMLTDKGLSVIVEGWPKLKEISFAGADINDYSVLTQLKNLKEVYTSGNVKKFPVMPHLEKLGIYGCDGFFDQIDQYPKLEKLSFSKCGVINEKILALVNVKSLELRDVTSDELKIIGKMTQLRKLDLRLNKNVDDEALGYLDKLNLKNINLNYTSVTEKGVLAYKNKHPHCTIRAYRKDY